MRIVEGIVVLVLGAKKKKKKKQRERKNERDVQVVPGRLEDWKRKRQEPSSRSSSPLLPFSKPRGKRGEKIFSSSEAERKSLARNLLHAARSQ